MPNRTPQTTAIIDEARRQNCVIYVVTLGMFCPQSLRDVAVGTRGMWYENVTTVEQAEDTYRRILYEAEGGSPCEITWQSEVACSSEKRLVEIEWSGATAEERYIPPTNAIASLQISPARLYMRSKPLGQRFDTIVMITATNAPFTVTGITSSHPAYDCNPKSFSLAKGESRSLTVSYTPTDSSYTWTRFDIATDRCSQEYYASGNYSGTPIKRSTLKLDAPNGGEEFVVGGDTVIRWSGVPKSDTVTLEYSTDRGGTWKNITDSATGGVYVWHLPKSPSAECLVRVIHRPDAGGGSDGGWAQSFGGINWEIGYDVVVDDSGYVYTTGFFFGTANFGAVTLTSAGLSDMFVTKQRRDGSLVWVQQGRGSGYEFGHGIDVDSSGNLYVVGSFANNAIIAGDTIQGAGSSDMFVAAFSPDGALRWVRHGGGKSDDDGADLVVDSKDNVHVIGSFNQSATFDGVTLTSVSNRDVYLLMYDSSGTLLDARSDGGPGYDGDYRNSITIDTLGNIYASGNFQNDASFGGRTVSSAGREDIFVAKYRPDHTAEWVEPGGGANQDYGFDVAVDALGNTYVTGEFTGTATFQGISLVSAGSSDGFLAKYDPTGTLAWVQRFGGSGEDRGNSLCVDIDDNIFVTGHCSNVATLGSINDMFVAKYQPDGTLQWIKQVNATRSASGYGITSDRSGAIYVTGELTGSGTFGGTTLTSQGAQGDAFIWKIGGETVQRDTSDALFSIIAPAPVVRDIDMGIALIGSTKDSVITNFVDNSGSHRFTVSDIWVTGPDANDFSLVSGIPPFEVPANGAHAVEFRFQPTSPGVKSAGLLVVIGGDTVIQSIRGEAVAPELTIVEPVIDFGAVTVGAAKDTLRAVTIANITGRPIKITATRHFGPNDRDFSTLAGGGGVDLPAGDTLRLDLRFTPSDIGRTSGVLLFDYSGAGSPARLQLFGEGIRDGASDLAIRSSDASGKPGDVVNVAILLDESSSLYQTAATSIRATLRFNATLLDPIGTTPRGTIVGQERSIPLEMPLASVTGNVLATLSFRVLLGNDISSALSLEDAEAVDAPIDIQTESGAFRLVGVCTDGGTRLVRETGEGGILKIRPNPLNGNGELSIRTVESGRTKVVVIDMFGQEVMVLHDGELAVGEHQLPIQRGELPTGSYTILMATPSERFVLRVDLIR